MSRMYAQVAGSNKKQLVELVINRKGVFIELRPIHKLYLSWSDTSDMFNRRTGSQLTKESISENRVAEIIENSFKADTTAWASQELDSVILVDKRDDYLRLPTHLREFSNKNKQLAKFYKKIVRRYNATQPAERDIASFSRPVFDNSGNYAIIEFDNGYLLSGRGYIVLYKWDAVWREIGILKRWVH